MKKSVLLSASEEDSAGISVMPPSIFTTCLVAGGLFELLFPWSFLFSYSVAMLAAGVVIVLAGVGFMMWGHGRFQVLEVNVPTNMPASRLVTEGAHGYSRNPMYVGFVAILVGFGVALNSVWMGLSFLPMLLYLSFYVIPREEAYLTRAFGEEYALYQKTVRRWL